MGANSFLSELTPIEKGGKKGNTLVASLKSVPIYIKISISEELGHCNVAFPIRDLYEEMDLTVIIIPWFVGLY